MPGRSPPPLTKPPTRTEANLSSKTGACGTGTTARNRLSPKIPHTVLQKNFRPICRQANSRMGTLDSRYSRPYRFSRCPRIGNSLVKPRLSSCTTPTMPPLYSPNGTMNQFRPTAYSPQPINRAAYCVHPRSNKLAFMLFQCSSLSSARI